MSSNPRHAWRFFTNHFEVLLYIGRHPNARLSTISDEVGITERAAHRILNHLVEEGYVDVTKLGRRNHYTLRPGTTLRHRANQNVPVRALLDIVNPLARDLYGDEPEG
jgi:DNA-binding IclR family transcriptional regulator